jgi:hypothetical protein
LLPEPPRRPFRRDYRNQRGLRLRWALLWFSALAGGGTSWLWLARQDASKEHVAAAERELRQLANLRMELERAAEIRPGNFRVYAESTARIADIVAKTPPDSVVREVWGRELEYLKEASADLEWMQQRVRQLEVIQGPVLTNEIAVNESTLRTGLNVLAEERTGPGRHFRPGLARALRSDLDRRLAEVKAQAALVPAPVPTRKTPVAVRAEGVKPPAAVDTARPAKAFANAGAAPKRARPVAVRSGVKAKKPAIAKARRPTTAERLRAIRAERDRERSRR